MSNPDGMAAVGQPGTPPSQVGSIKGALAEFAQAYLRRLPDEYASELSDEELYSQIRSIFDFVNARRTEPLIVRVFDPTHEEHGYSVPGTVVEINVDDSPFLVDSVASALEGAGYGVVVDAHTVVGIVRSDDGMIEDIRHARQSERRESVQHHQLNRKLSAEERTELDEIIRKVLADVRLAVRDFEPMQKAIDRMIEVARGGGARYSQAIIDEAVEFLEWTRRDNFVYLGYREYRFVDTEEGPALVVDADSGLGILSDASQSKTAKPVPLTQLPPDLQARYAEGFLLVIAKTNRPSTVHRPHRMDYLGVRHVGPDGEVIGEARMLGLFTSRALMSESAGIPIIREKLQQVLEKEDLIEGSHDYKAVIQIFNSFPKDEAFSMPVEDLRRSIQGLLAMERKEHVRLFVRPDLLRRSVSLMVVLPRDRFNADLRRSLQALFQERYGGSAVDYRLALTEAGPARIHFTVWVEGGSVPDVSFDELQQEVVELSRTWEDRVSVVLGQRLDHAVEIVREWSPRLPDYYKTSTSLDVAAGDIIMLRELAAGDAPFVVGAQNEAKPIGGLTRLAVYSRDARLELSTILPGLEALGLRVVEEVPTRLQGDGEDIFIHDFGVRTPTGGQLDLARNGDRVTKTVDAVLAGLAESDSLDRLVVASALTYQQIGVLRAYRTYWRRVSPAFTVEYVNGAFAAHPDIAEQLVALFEKRFDPMLDDSDTDSLVEEINARLDKVESLDVDRILRGFMQLILATVRTNAYQADARSLSLKLRSKDVPGMPEPRPLFEIFVYAPEVEGVHLRGGRVARGGIRWSDRREDYRTEILGLMKAQVTKNTVIVPTGSKGGFIVRQVPADTDVREAVKRAYETFIRGLLDVTDNLVAGEVVPPAAVRRYDEDDPYLVVAADKGTASFSDVANAISEEYGFWLGDAFASGGSRGYDHKALGITAKGAWESVRRHFLDLGTDVDSQVITAVGIGDMSGDVFGNGMLRSPHLKLIGAFDHRHIFLDPDPDPSTGFEERQRLYQLPRSSWADYNTDLLSEGGGVFSRSLKRVVLSPQVRSALATDADALTPDELIKSILRAPVDLLWNGGIGTYVKASWESQFESEDRANDGVRVDGSDLRCWVVGEGGNLGFTQQGRIEFSRRGGRINTDFIDNSGGVDCSDREVNLKILLRMAEERGELDTDERAEVIAAVTDDITERVLYDNFLQAQILSQEAERSRSLLEAYEDLMKTLERHGLLNRRLEDLPATDDLLERARDHEGMVRPELAVLLSYAKQDLANALVDSELPDGPDVADDLNAYFPPAIVERFGHLIPEHPLYREMAATILANEVINAEGVTFVNRLQVETGATQPEVVRAYRLAYRLTGAGERWRAVEQLEFGVDPELRRDLLVAIDWLVESTTRWFLARPAGKPELADLQESRNAFARLEASLSTVGPDDWRAEHDQQVVQLESAGVPKELATRHVYHDELVHGADIIDLAQSSGREVPEVAELFLLLGSRYRLDWLEERADALTAATRWQRWAIRSLQNDLVVLRRELAEWVLAGADGRPIPEALEAYIETRSGRHNRLESFMQMLGHEGGTDLDSLMVATKQIYTLAS